MLRLLLFLFAIAILTDKVVLAFIGISIVCFCFFVFYSRSRPRSLESTVIYVVVKDGFGKFGITKLGNSKSKEKAVKRRYSGDWIDIRWCKIVPSRDIAYSYESFCKNHVSVIKGNEWFPAHQVDKLIHKISRSKYG